MAATSKNTKINIDSDTFTLSEPAKNWQQWIKQKSRHYSTGKHYKALHQFLLGLYSFSHFLFYPLLAATTVLVNWQFAVATFSIRFIVQLLILYPVTKKLREKDLFPIFLFFDIAMFFYYLFFAFALVKKPKQQWK